MRVLITGIGGLLGSRFARWMLDHERHLELWGIDDFSCGYVENVPRDVDRLLPIRLGDGLMRDLPDFDYVFHFAAYAAEGLSPFIRCYNYRNNLVASAEVLNHVLRTGCDRYVYASSMSVYGRGDPPFDETAPRSPIDPYGVAKAACERDIEIAGEQHGLDWSIVRPHNLYGPGQSIWQRYRNVLGLFMARHLEGLPLLIYGDGLQRRAFSYIDDCLPSFWAAATRPEASRRIVNLGGREPVTILDAALLTCQVMGGGRIEHREPRHEVRDAWSTVQRSIDLLGYRETTALREGIRRMWRWAQAAWDQFPERRGKWRVAEIEVERGLYEYWREA